MYRIRMLLIIFLLFILNCSHFIDGYDEKKQKAKLESLSDETSKITKFLEEQEFTALASATHDHGLIYTVKINQKKAKILLDTGASHTFINKAYQDDFFIKAPPLAKNETKPITTFLGTKTTDYFQTYMQEFMVGDVVFRPWPLIVLDMYIEHGLLGVDFLDFTCGVLIIREGIFCFNIDHRRAVGLKTIVQDSGYTEVDMIMIENQDDIKIKWHQGEGEKEKLKSGIYFVEMNLDGLDCIMLLDTGAIATTIFDTYVSEGKIKKFLFFKPTIWDLDGRNASVVNRAIMDNLKIGNYNVGKNKIYVLKYLGKGKSVKYKNKQFAGYLGMDILLKNNAIIDFGNNKMYLKKRDR